MLVSLSTVTAFAQTPETAYIATDKQMYHYGDEIQISGQLSEPQIGNENARMHILGKISGDIIMPDTVITIDELYQINHMHPTTAEHPTYEISFPHDGTFIVSLTYQPIGEFAITLTTEFQYVEFPFDVINRFNTIETDIITLQNATGGSIPPDLLARIDSLETQVATIPILQSTITGLETQITSLEGNLTALQSQQVPTNAELQTSISSNDNDIMMMGLNVSSLQNDLDNPEGLWSRVNDLQIAETEMSQDVSGNSQDITSLQGDVSQIQTEITTIVIENATPQDVEQNLRMDRHDSYLDQLRISTINLNAEVVGIESNITTLQDQQVPTNAELQNTIRRVVGGDPNSEYPDMMQLGQSITILRTNDVTTNDRIDGVQTNVTGINAQHIVDTERFDRFTEATTLALQFQGQRGQDNQDKIDVLETGAAFVSQLLPQYNDAIVENQDDITKIGQKITRFDTDLTDLEQVVTVNHQKLWNDVNGGKVLHGQLLDSIAALDLQDREFQSRIDGFNQHLLTVDGQVQILRTDVNNLQANNPSDDATQNQRLTDLESDLRFLGVEVYERLYPDVRTLEFHIPGIDQSIQGFIEEHVAMWAEIDRKANILDAN